MCDARNEHAVVRLRARKGRPAKPLAVMLPWSGRDGLDYARMLARLSPLEAAALCDSARPIVLAERSVRAPLAPSVAPGLREIGLMLPYSPLHHLLLEDFGAALVATSGNVSGEPVLTEPDEARKRLAGVADGFLHHDRPIARPADDPVVRVIAGVARAVRLGRGTAPLELELAAAHSGTDTRRGGLPEDHGGAGLGGSCGRVAAHRRAGESARPGGIRAGGSGSAGALRRARALHCARCASELSQHALGARVGAADPARLAPSCACGGRGGRVPRRSATAVFYLGRHGSRAGCDTLGRGGAARRAGGLDARRELPSLPLAGRRARGARAVALRARAVLGIWTSSRRGIRTAATRCCARPGRAA